MGSHSRERLGEIMFFQEENQASLTSYFFQKHKYTYSAAWFGELIKPLGLSDGSGIDVSDYDSLENNRHPCTGKQLIRKNSSGIQRRGANILLFSPKSMSILIVANMTWNQEIANILMEIFLRSVRKLLNFIELEHAQARIRTETERKTVKTKALLFATFTHLFQSQMSPFVHAHVRLFQPTKVDDEFYTLRNELIKKSTNMYGILFRANLMWQLQKIGLETIVTDKKHGFFEIKGYEEITKIFPSRSSAIKKHMTEHANEYPHLSKRMNKMISIRRNRQINNDESDVTTVLISIVKKLEDNGYEKKDFDIFRITNNLNDRRKKSVESLLYLSYLQYGEKLFEYSKEAVMKVVAHHAITLNHGVRIEDLLVTLDGENFVDHIRRIIAIQKEKHNNQRNYHDTRNINKSRIVVNYAEGALARARRVSESARISINNVDEDYQYLDDTIQWSIYERLLDLCDRESGVYRKTLGLITSHKALVKPIFDIFAEQEIDQKLAISTIRNIT